jgi:hypothetical protein
MLKGVAGKRFPGGVDFVLDPAQRFGSSEIEVPAALRPRFAVLSTALERSRTNGRVFAGLLVKDHVLKLIGLSQGRRLGAALLKRHGRGTPYQWPSLSVLKMSKAGITSSNQLFGSALT